MEPGVEMLVPPPLPGVPGVLLWEWPEDWLEGSALTPELGFGARAEPEPHKSVVGVVLEFSLLALLFALLPLLLWLVFALLVFAIVAWGGSLYPDIVSQSILVCF